MIRGTWEHLSSDVMIEIIAWRSGLSVSQCAALYEIVIREDGWDLFVELFQTSLDNV